MHVIKMDRVFMWLQIDLPGTPLNTAKKARTQVMAAIMDAVLAARWGHTFACVCSRADLSFMLQRPISHHSAGECIAAILVQHERGQPSCMRLQACAPGPVSG